MVLAVTRIFDGALAASLSHAPPASDSPWLLVASPYAVLGRELVRIVGELPRSVTESPLAAAFDLPSGWPRTTSVEAVRPAGPTAETVGARARVAADGRR